MLYDCLVIGAGPAGLSAAIYMGRFLRRVLVIDDNEGRSTHHQTNDNYLGFPNGVKITELRLLGRQQAARFGAEYEVACVEKLERHGKHFTATTSNGQFEGKTVILCTGVADRWPDIPCVEEYIGRTLFWCITCDGFRTVDKNVVLFGGDDEAALTACQFLRYTKTVTFIAGPGKLACSAEHRQTMLDHKIEVVEGKVAAVEGTPEKIEAVVLEDGRRFPADVMFSLLGCDPNVQLGIDLGLALAPDGYILIDEEGYTSVPGVFAAGDLTNRHTHQVAAAVCEGAEAGQTANYYLYDRYQQNG